MSERKKNYKSAYRSEKKKLYDNKENYKNKEKPDKKISMMDKFMRLFETSR